MTHIGIISCRRPTAPALMKQHLEGLEVTWYVKDKIDLMSYIESGCNDGRVVIGGGLCEARNLILKNAWEENETAVMMDDDLMRIEMMAGKDNKLPITVKHAIKEMEDALDGSGLKLAGAAPTPNDFWYNPSRPFSFRNFIIAAMMVIRPCDLFFDENLRTKEDYDYTLQHIDRYGGAIRLNYVLPSFRHYGNKGGVVDYRTPELEQKSIAYLKDKWPNCIRDNPKRENEILLSIPSF